MFCWKFFLFLFRSKNEMVSKFNIQVFKTFYGPFGHLKPSCSPDDYSLIWVIFDYISCLNPGSNGLLTLDQSLVFCAFSDVFLSIFWSRFFPNDLDSWNLPGILCQVVCFLRQLFTKNVSGARAQLGAAFTQLFSELRGNALISPKRWVNAAFGRAIM